MSETNPSLNEVIAIDGPSASGKSTVSRLLAEKLEWIYVDSGSFYRGITWKAVREGIDVEDGDAVYYGLMHWTWEIYLEDRTLLYRIDGVNPGQDVRSESVTDKVSYIASIPEVREVVVERLRESAALGPLVMEGRDIGSVVFPGTPWKYYLDADPNERARRRNQEMSQTEDGSDVDKVMNSLARRDKMDSTRKTAPLQIPLGATVINSTDMSAEDVVDHILKNMSSRSE